jgi:hypothetical protein
LAGREPPPRVAPLKRALKGDRGQPLAASRGVANRFRHCSSGLRVVAARLLNQQAAFRVCLLNLLVLIFVARPDAELTEREL